MARAPHAHKGRPDEEPKTPGALNIHLHARAARVRRPAHILREREITTTFYVVSGVVYARVYYYYCLGGGF